MEKNEILLIYGYDPVKMAEKIAEAAGLSDLIGDRKKRIGLKPNLVVSRPALEGATTHPEIAHGIINYLKKNGFDNIVILEGSWVGDSTAKAFSACGYTSLAKKLGIELIDTQKDEYQTIDCKGLDIEICQSALDLDFMINLPVFKGHCQTLLTCALKNNKGLISNNEKRRFHSLGLDKPIAHLNTAIRSDFIIVDGICGDLDFEEGGNPVFGHRLFAARDPVLCDAWAADLMGYDAIEIPYISLAEKLGVGSKGPPVVIELNKCSDALLRDDDNHVPYSLKSSRKVKLLSGFIHEEGACSACYSSLVFALSRLGRTEREDLGRISIGQEFRGVKDRLGVGQCTEEFDHFCPGCPPTGMDVLTFLREELSR
ncbi:MAG: DUF362 domain-containing protein [Treponema sp.]|nr:DUF362 domain-containing protein [Treponema sp.]